MQCVTFIRGEILRKMADQIEMSTAEGPAQNIFLQNFNFFGRTPIPMKTTFSFATPATPSIGRSNTNSDQGKDATGSGNSKDSIGVNTTWTPYNTSMAIAKERENSFITWPRQIVQKASDFVPSGFYYTGHGDLVQCFFCGLFLKHWSHTDRVDVEHRKYSPECKFQLLM